MKNKQGITIAALIIAIVGLSIGFAAFSNQLNISGSASVNPSSENFVVKFSKVSNADQTGSSYPITPIVDQGSTATGQNGIIDSSDPLTLTNLQAAFTQPGQSVSYKLYIRNTGAYTAYLTNINFKNLAGKNVTKDYIGDATDSLMRAALADMSVSVTLGGTDGVGGTTYTEDNNSISNVSLAAGDSIEAYVTITYANNGNYVDGNMVVLFGDIKIQYRSVDTPLAIPDPTVEDQELVAPEYIVTVGGEITAYNGSGGTVTIPSTLPLYTSAGKETLVVEKCIPAAIQYGGLSAEDAPGACEQVKADIEAGKTTAQDGASQMTEQFYSSLKSMGAVVDGYYATGASVTVTSIGDNAFVNKNITSVTIPNSVTSIGEYAFSENNLTSVKIPDSVETIGIGAFNNNNITSVTIGSGITTIGTGAFGTGSTSSHHGPNAITSVTINALKANVSGIDMSIFGYDSNANCTNTVSGDYKSNSCITWVNG